MASSPLSILPTLAVAVEGPDITKLLKSNRIYPKKIKQWASLCLLVVTWQISLLHLQILRLHAPAFVPEKTPIQVNILAQYLDQILPPPLLVDSK